MTQISIIVPVYNAAETLRPCVDSILNLEYQDYELLLIDDGSTDNSLSICEEYANRDKRIQVFHQNNRGVSSARNKGLQLCSGNWVTFVDSDDMVSVDYLNGVVDSKEDLLIVGYWNLSPDGNEFWSRHTPSCMSLPKISDYITEMMGSFELRGPYCKFYRKSMLFGIFFHEDMKVAEDSCMVFEYLSRVKTLKVIPHAYYIFRCHVKSAEQRYKVSVDYAINSLNHLKKAYEGLVTNHRIKKNGLLTFIGFFKAASYDDWKETPSKWYGNIEIKKLYRYVWPDLSLNQKVRLIGSFILRK